MEIIIGRNQETRQLSIATKDVNKVYGQNGYVPMDVSRQHISLTSKDNGKWQIKNLNDQNVTFVNGIAIECKTITEFDKVELGKSHFVFEWELLKLLEDSYIDVTPLEKIWNEYNDANINITKRQKNLGLLASIPIAITMLGGLIASIASDDVKPYAYIFTATALVVMVYGFYKRFTDNSIDEREKLKKDFQRNYICPKCGHFLGFVDYDILIQNEGCLSCKTKYKK